MILTESQLILLVVLIVWDMGWKVAGAIRAYDHKAWGWFVAIIFLNTLGILPIYYLYRTKPTEVESQP